MTVMSPSPMNAPSIVSPSSTVRQITSATGQEEQVDFIVSLGCENGRGNSSIFHPRLTYTPTSPRRENTHLRTLNTAEPGMSPIDLSAAVGVRRARCEDDEPVHQVDPAKTQRLEDERQGRR